MWFARWECEKLTTAKNSFKSKFWKRYEKNCLFNDFTDSPRKPMQVIFFNELAVSEQRIKNAMSTFG
jgi:hypothetical protein